MLVDDEASVRQGLRMRIELEPDLEVVGEAADGLQAAKLALILAPDVIVMDLEMPKMDGIAATDWLREVMPQVAVVILSMYGDGTARADASAAGAKDFVEKQEGVETLLDAIRRAAR
jgi:DNA-binding NarL/FixJ family response regulator